MSNTKDFIDSLLFEYDLIETDENTNYNITGALLEATQYNPAPHPRKWQGLRTFYGWLGFIVSVTIVAMIVATAIHFLSTIVIGRTAPQVTVYGVHY